MPGLKDISVTFHANIVNERGTLGHLSSHVESGDSISVLDTNGAGKSTLLNVISGSIMSNSGATLLDEEDITVYPEYKRAREIGRLFQDPLKGTTPHMTIEKNLGLAYSRGKRTTLGQATKKGDRSFFIERLKELGLGLEDRTSTAVRLLSGRQQQVLTLLMSIITTPKLLPLDKYTAALDSKMTAPVMDITKRIIKESHTTTPMTVHDMKQALECGSKTIILNEGRIAKALEGEERKNTTVDGLFNIYGFV